MRSKLLKLADSFNKLGLKLETDSLNDVFSLKDESLKSFREIRENLASAEHHHLRLQCVVCDNMSTCRCRAEKTLMKGICDKCE